MLLQTKIFELCNGKYKNPSELAQAMEIPVEQLYRVHQGKDGINQEFIIGSIKSFPEYEFGDLFYFTHKLPHFAKAKRRQRLVLDTLIIGLSTALLWHFFNIWRYGQYLIGEPNIVIRSVETFGLLLILAFGISKYIRDLKGKRR